MKNILSKFSILMLTALFVFSACTDLEEELYSEVTADNFFQTEDEFIAALGAAYSSMTGIGNHSNLWSTNEIASDELVITTKGSDWFDGGVLIELHDHSFNPSNGFFNNTWGFLYGGINTCNRLIFTFEELEAAGNSDAAAFIAELRAVRALWYYWAMDAFGNVPLSIDFTDETPPANNADFQAGRTAVFNFIESELNAVIPLLTTTVGGSAYGRMNQAAAYALQTKLYLNAEVYTGSPRWAEAEAAADNVIAAGFSLSSVYSENFAIENSGSPENIFVVPYDKVFAGGFNWPMMVLHYSSQFTFNFTAQPWNGYGVVEEFYNSYWSTDPADLNNGSLIGNPGPQGPVWQGLADFSASDVVPSTMGTVDRRMSNFLVGPQFNADGTPTVDTAFENEETASPDPDGERLNFTPANNEIFPNGWRQGGARIQKYQYELGGTPNMSNDFVIFRLADIMLAKAEAQFAQGNTGGALTLVNQIRARAGVDDFTALTAEDLLAERGREMFAEISRRQDLIRFEVSHSSSYGWSSPWWEKPLATPADKRVFPIPQVQLDASAALNQNPGY